MRKGTEITYINSKSLEEIKTYADNSRYEPKLEEVLILRNRTGMPLLRCKYLMKAAKGDIEKAMDIEINGM